jgi:hypothetical protein
MDCKFHLAHTLLANPWTALVLHAGLKSLAVVACVFSSLLSNHAVCGIGLSSRSQQCYLETLRTLWSDILQNLMDSGRHFRAVTVVV